MIPKDKIKEIVFLKYQEYLKIAVEKHSSVKRAGVYPDELLNEAILGILDCRISFNTVDEIDSFIVKAIKSVAGSELSEASKKITSVTNDSGEDYELLGDSEKEFEYSGSEYAARSEELYDVFYDYRFPSGVECPECGCKNVTAHSAGNQCKICRTAISLTSRTFLHNNRLGCAKTYSLIREMCKDPYLSSLQIKNKINSSFAPKKICYRIREIIIQTNCFDEIQVLKKALSPVKFDDEVKGVTMPNFTAIWSANTYEDIRAEYINGSTVIEIAKKYSKSYSRITQILNGEKSRAFNFDTIHKVVFETGRRRLAKKAKARVKKWAARSAVLPINIGALLNEIENLQDEIRIMNLKKAS